MELIRFENGLRVVLDEMPRSKSAAICVYIGCGSHDEEKPCFGASHFIEHMLFKGTETRSAAEISEQMDEIGGNLNAYTTKEFTCVYSQTLEEHLPIAAEILSDMLLRSKMTPQDVETERSVILEEIGMYEDSFEELCMDRLYLKIYPDSALGGNILGTRESVRQMTADRLRAHMAKYYVPERTVISVCGKFQKETLLEILERQFGGLHNTKNPISVRPAVFSPGVTTEKKTSEQTHLIIAMPGLKIGAPERFAHAIFSTILGGTSSSRLYQRIREELGLAYSIYSFSGAHLEGGVFGVGAAVAHGAQRQTVNEIFSVLKDIKNGISEKEFLRTREQFKASLAMGLEQNGSRASAMGRSILLEGEYLDEETILEKLDGLTPQEVSRAANKILDFDRIALSVVGRPEKQEFYNPGNYL